MNIFQYATEHTAAFAFLVVAAGVTLPKLLAPALVYLNAVAKDATSLLWSGFTWALFATQPLEKDSERHVVKYLTNNARALRFAQAGTRKLSRSYAKSVMKQVFIWVLGGGDDAGARRSYYVWRRRLVWLTWSNEGAICLRQFRWNGGWKTFFEASARWFQDQIDEDDLYTRTPAIVYYRASGTEIEKRSETALKGEAAAAIFQERARQEYETMDPVGWPAADLGEPLSDVKGGEALSFSAPMRKIFRTARFWHQHRGWYAERQLPWRWGLLLYGQPGTGKTSLVRALSEDLGVDVHVFDLAGMTNRDFTSAWSNSCSAGTRIVLIEDIDAIFNGRENITEDNGKVTFDCLLNAIGGIKRMDGMLLVITTNDVSKIDPALGAPLPGEDRSTRPGRIDMAVELPPLRRDALMKIALRVTKDEEMAAKVVDEAQAAGDTPAQITDRAIRAATEALWGGFNPDADEDAGPDEVARTSQTVKSDGERRKIEQLIQELSEHIGKAA